MTDEQSFAVWYKQYPKKKAVGDARKAWGQTKKDRPLLEEMLKVLTAQCHSEEWRKDDGKFIPYPATYLRRLQFFDELEVTLPEDKVAWKDTWPGIVAKGKEYGLTEKMFDHPQKFKEAVLKAADNVIQLKSA